MGPLALPCESCGKEAECFRHSLHGYDSEIGQFPPPDFEGADLYACPGCAGSNFHFVARFEYIDSVSSGQEGGEAGRDRKIFSPSSGSSAGVGGRGELWVISSVQCV